MNNNEWIENTGIRPVEHDVRVDVKFREGKVIRGSRACRWYWPISDSLSDIVHWSLSEEMPQEISHAEPVTTEYEYPKTHYETQSVEALQSAEAERVAAKECSKAHKITQIYNVLFPEQRLTDDVVQNLIDVITFLEKF